MTGGGTPFESFPAPSSAEESHSPYDKQRADYSLYLVTDSTPKILPVGKSVCDVVEAALRGDSSGGGAGGAGGVTCVQYREKHADTGAMIATARELHAITREYGRPLLINDRVDVALAVGCEGVHIGQDDIGEFKCILSLGWLHIYCFAWGIRVAGSRLFTKGAARTNIRVLCRCSDGEKTPRGGQDHWCYRV